MNIHQFQYILALAELRHFENAAEKCFISQSTLSTMISKFEDEVGIMIFDRKKKPLEVTAEGVAIIEHLKKISKEIDSLHELTNELKGEIKGKLSIAVIPTIAPFLLPLCLHKLAAKFPDLQLEVRELTTSEIMRLIKSRELDMGIISTPMGDTEVIEHHLYDEQFVFFDASVKNRKEIKFKQLDLSNLCLLEEGHCMRNQVIELCDLHHRVLNNQMNYQYKAGSIDSLLKFVKASDASTLLPYLSTIDLPKKDQRMISFFSEPMPFRSVGLVVHRHFVKRKVLELIHQEIMACVNPLLLEKKGKGKQLSPA